MACVEADAQLGGYGQQQRDDNLDGFDLAELLGKGLGLVRVETAENRLVSRADSAKLVVTLSSTSKVEPIDVHSWREGRPRDGHA